MHRTKKGFTLIEFMVAMSLVAILSTLAIGNFMGTQKRGRDVRRQSDLNQYRVALENYSSNTSGLYPVFNGMAPTILATPLQSYMTGFPTDPQGLNYRYLSSDGLTYLLDACMEVQKALFEICSNGKSGVTNLSCTTAIDVTCDL